MGKYIGIDEFIKHSKDEECLVYDIPEGALPRVFFTGKAKECLDFIKREQEAECYLSTVREFRECYDVPISSWITEENNKEEK